MWLKFAVFFSVAAGAAWGASLEPASSAEFCGRCHRSILQAWKSSAHANAMESSLFQQGLEQTENELGTSAARNCLGCHAPMAAMTGDSALRMKVSWEGVTCDYCHSVRDVSLTGVNPAASLELSLTKSGPLNDVSSPAHATRFSSIHTSSLICAPCHEYRNPAGFGAFTTYSEWKASRYAKDGWTCQSCHMYKVAGDVVDPKILRSAEAKVNLHQMPGSHSLEQLTKTIKANLSTLRESGQLRVSLEVSNSAAGHYVPTGSPMRQVLMELSVDSYDGRHFLEERRYRRTVADQNGKPMDREYYAILRGVRLLSDTRLAPDEKRTETFSFPIADGVSAQVKASFWYLYSPAPGTGLQERIAFLTISRFMR